MDFKTNKQKYYISTYLLLTLIFIVDIITGWEIFLTPLYFVPVLLIGLYEKSINRDIFIISIVSFLLWLLREFLLIEMMKNMLIFYWNILIRITSYIIILFLLISKKNYFEILRKKIFI